MLDGTTSSNNKIDYRRVLTAIGIFRAAPFSLKEFIYDNGTWLKTYPLAQKDTDGAKRTAKNISALDALRQASDVTSKNNTFKYIQNYLTHRPFYIDADTCLPSPHTSNDEVARDCALRLITDWIEWLKQKNIYDNTMIVLVSDHGSRSFGYSLGAPLTRANALLMVKDFGRRGALAQSDSFMSNADVPAIVCATIGGCPGIESDPRQKSTARTLYLVKGNNKKNHYRITDSNTVYQVKDNIFDAYNWSIIK